MKHHTRRRKPEQPEISEEQEEPGTPAESGDPGTPESPDEKESEITEITEKAEDTVDEAEPAEPAESEEPEASENPDDPEEEKNKSEKPEKKKHSALKAFIFLILKLAVFGVIIWAALTYVFGVYRLSGNTMYPALKDGDLCVVYRLDPYYSTDVVVYRVGDEICFGRIVAWEGDTVNGDSMGLLINGGRPAEEVFFSTKMQDINLELPVKLKAGEVMILNDMREDLHDSRTYGIINVEDIEGKVIFIFRRRGI